MTLEEAVAWCLEHYAVVSFAANEDGMSDISTGEHYHGPGVYVRVGAELGAFIPGIEQRGSTLQEAIERLLPRIPEWQERSDVLRAARDKESWQRLEGL